MKFEMAKMLISRDEWMEAATFGRIETLERWLKSGVLGVSYTGRPVRGNVFDITDNNKRNALFNAIEFGQVNYAKRLLEIGVFAETRSVDGQTPLSKASENGMEEVVSRLLLLGHGMEVQDKKGATPLTHAILNKRIEENRDVFDPSAWIGRYPGTQPG